MNKPNITKGKWEVVDRGFVVNDEKHLIARMYTNEGVEFVNLINNAKAISAVPEMIDALIAVYNDLEECDDWGSDISTTTIEKVITSLLNAGCTE